MDIPQILLNILAQVMFFVVNIFVIPGIAEHFIIKDSDAKNIVDSGDKLDTEIVMLQNELNKLKSDPKTTKADWDKFNKKGEALKKKVERHQKKGKAVLFIYKVLDVIESWTILPIEKFIRFVILLVSFNAPKIEFSINEGVLNIYLSVRRTNLDWLNPIKQIGMYINNVVHVLFGTACGIGLLYLLLPATLNSMIPALNQWAAFGSGTLNLQYFLDINNVFVDAAWNKLVVGGFYENPVFLVIFAICFGFIFANRTFDVTDEDGKISNECRFIPITMLLIALFNVTFWLISPATYAVVSQYITFAGMILLFTVIIKEFSLFVVYCTKKVAEWLWDKIKSHISPI